VLVVDDVAGNRAVVMDLLTSLGFDVLEADNGEAALTLIEAERPDLVLMDILMPVMDGLTATQRLRLLPAHATRPVIVLSAGVSDLEREKSLQVGADAFLVKPIDFGELLRHVGKLLRLGWCHAAPPEAEAAEPEAEHAAMVGPPPDEVEQLYRLARIGNMRSIRQRAEQLAAQDARYTLFAERLEALASRFQSRAILELIARYRAEGATP
jgi:CheY-like chemotaxis protein